MNPKEYAYNLVNEIFESVRLDLYESNRVAQFIIQKRLEDPHFGKEAEKDTFLVDVLAELIEDGWK